MTSFNKHLMSAKYLLRIKLPPNVCRTLLSSQIIFSCMLDFMIKVIYDSGKKKKKIFPRNMKLLKSLTNHFYTPDLN